MIEVIVSDEQAEQIGSAASVVYLRDSRGELVGQVTPVRSARFSPQEIAELEKRLDAPGTRRTLREVNDELESRYGT